MRAYERKRQRPVTDIRRSRRLVTNHGHQNIRGRRLVSVADVS